MGGDGGVVHRGAPVGVEGDGAVVEGWYYRVRMVVFLIVDVWGYK